MAVGLAIIFFNDRPGFGIAFRDDVYNAKDTIHTVTKDLDDSQLFAVTGDPWARTPGDDKAHKISVK